ncbi:MAG: InlB B-repeat-containing protein, partial [Kiritimatiellae bacterium]|nr:InlB B-repeat-containing protein [Kiritimatiellia bacterium]
MSIGGSGSFVVTDNEKSFYSSSADGGQGGNGGGGYSGGGGTRTSGEASTYHDNYDSDYGYSKTGAGGTGGNGGSQGNAGSLYKMSTATLTASPARIPSEVTALSGSENEVVNTTVTFKHNSSANVADQTRSASLAFASPAAPSMAYAGHVFLGYYTEASGGSQIYDASLNCVYSVWPYTENLTLYAHWLRLSNLTFLSDEGSGLVEVGTAVAQKGLALPAAPGTTRTDWNFAGYWTDPEGGTMVYDENLDPVASAWDSTQDMTLYAHWTPVSASFYLTLKSDGSTVSRDLVRQGDAVESVSVPAKANHSFQGYWTDATSGTQFFHADGTPVNSTWNYYPELTLHAHWVPAYSVTFVSMDEAVGSSVYAEVDTGAAAPIPFRSGDYIFLGYFTEDGSQVFDASGALVAGGLSGQAPDVTLYAHWAPPEGSVVKLVYRGQLNLLAGGPAVNDEKYVKRMHFRVYDDAEAPTPLWSIDDQDVTVNADGSFVHSFGDDALAALIATG